MSKSPEPGLFDSGPALPEGFRYQSGFLAEGEERDLVPVIETLPFDGF